MILSALNVNTDTRVAIEQALRWLMPIQWAQSYQHWMSIGQNHSYQTSSYMIKAKPMGTILLALNVNTDTSLAIKQALTWSMPSQWAQSYQLWMSIGHNHSYQTSSYMIKAKPMGTLLLALNVNMDIRLAIKKSYYMINAKPMGTIISALNVNTDTSVAIKQALRWLMPIQWAQSYQLWMSIGTQL